MNEKIKRAIRSHYGLGRPVTDLEAQAEIANIERRLRSGQGLDDLQLRLKSKIEGAGFAFLTKNPAKLERCVKEVKGKKGVRSAYGICTASLQKTGEMSRRGRRRKNPGFQGPSQWYIHIQRYAGNRGIGPVMLYNGKSFSDRPDARPYGFSSKTAAASMARRLLTNNRKLAPYKMWVAPALYGEARVDRAVNPYRVMTTMRGRAGKVKGKTLTSPADSETFATRTEAEAHAARLAKIDKDLGRRGVLRSVRKNPSSPGLDEAAHKLEEFTGRTVGDVIEGKPRSKDKTGLVIGELDLIGYRQAREGIDGGRMTRFAHKFRKNSRPLLAVSTDGKQLHIVGGQYEFTDAGIEDR
jgi:hypothetical protein